MLPYDAQTSANSVTLLPGQQFGSYEILGTLGAGGMGEVYRARDLRLGREVAIKTLRRAFTADPDRLARFEREARAMASLSHPNIAAIHGLEEQNGVQALVLELVEGETLAERISRAPHGLPMREALDLARQIVDALDAAHGRGIIHRDLKPANIKIARGGSVKVLDFGLAKLQPDAVGEVGSTTVVAGDTREGTILGTAAYMSPEQARGQMVDKRTDIWAFGCVLYEMLTGRAVFGRATLLDTLAVIREREPELDALPGSTPAAVRRLLERGLAKTVEQRLRDIGDARYDLDPAAGNHEAPGALAPRRSYLAAAVVAVAAVSIVLAAVVYTRGGARTPPAAVTRLTIPLAVEDFFNFIGQRPAAVSPDGRQVVFAINQRLYVRRLDQLDAQPIAGTDPPAAIGAGRGPDWANNPFFSPDGQWVGFSQGGDLMKVPTAGGRPVKLVERAGAISPSRWLSDDTIIYARGVGDRGLAQSIWRVPASGGAPEEIVTLADGVAHAPQLMPGGTDLLFTLLTGPAIANADEADIVVQSLATGERHVVLHGGHSARYVDGGYLLYGRDRTLFGVRYDPTQYKTIGTPVALVSDVAQEVASGSWLGLDYDLSANGTLVYLPDSAVRLRRVLEWVDREGRGEPFEMEERPYQYPRFSPDGLRVLLDLRDQQNDAWVWTLDSRTLTRVSFNRRAGGPVIWTADGTRAFFGPTRNGPPNIFWAPVSGGAEERLLTSANTQYANAATPDGRYLVFEEVDPQTEFDLRLLSLDGTREWTPLVQTPFNEQNAALSADGAWLAYQSDESGRAEIYVRPFPEVNAARWPVSTAGGTRPLWSRDGRELFFLDLDRRLTVVSVDTTPAFRAGPARTLFDTKPFGLEGINRNFDISPDGSRFLFVRNRPVPPDAKRLVVVQHWFEELERLLPR